MKNKKNIEKPALYLISIVELLALIIMAFVLSLVLPMMAKSFILGAMTFYIPSTVFSWVSYRQIGARAQHQVVKNFYLAELIKYVLTVLLFAYIFIILESVDAQTVFIAYMIFWLIHQVCIGFLFRRRKLSPVTNKNL